MLYDKRQKVRTPADRLRELLGQLEVQLGKLDYSTADELLRIPVLFDDAHNLMAELQQSGAALVGEQVRLESLGTQFKRRASQFMRGIGGAAVLGRARRRYAPEVTRWWWFVDAHVTAQKQAQLRRRLRGLGLMAGVLAVIVVVYVLVFAPDEATRERFRHQQEAERLAQEGDYVTALGEIEAALGFAPDVAELHVWRGVLLALLERTEEAESAFSAAQMLLPDRVAFLALRAQTYMSVRLPEVMLQDTQEILAVSPESAQGYFLQGRAYHLLQSYTLAEVSYQTAAELASAAGDTQLEALARVNLAYLMQERMGGQ